MGMTIDDAIKKYKNNAEYERTHGNLQGCLEFQQLAGWLKDYKRLLEQEPRWIPVSERLPKNRGFYLVSTTDCITIMEFISGWISQNIGLCNGYVKAWMPLPQPYKAESEAADG